METYIINIILFYFRYNICLSLEPAYDGFAVELRKHIPVDRTGPCSGQHGSGLHHSVLPWCACLLLLLYDHKIPALPGEDVYIAFY